MKTRTETTGTRCLHCTRTICRITILIVLITLWFFNLNAQSKPSLQFPVTYVQQIYTSQIGVREKGNNSGPAVEQYLRYVNLPKENPWCAAFVCWVFGRAGVGNPRSGWSPDLFRKSYVIWERGLSKTVSEPGTKSQESRLPAYVPGVYPSSLVTGNRQPGSYRLITPSTGDIFALYFPEKRRIAHVGFIDQWDGTWLISVEGNTNISGSREGDGVYRKRRLVRTIYKVARYIN